MKSTFLKYAAAVGACSMLLMATADTTFLLKDVTETVSAYKFNQVTLDCAGVSGTLSVNFLGNDLVGDSTAAADAATMTIKGDTTGDQADSALALTVSELYISNGYIKFTDSLPKNSAYVFENIRGGGSYPATTVSGLPFVFFEYTSTIGTNSSFRFRDMYVQWEGTSSTDNYLVELGNIVLDKGSSLFVSNSTLTGSSGAILVGDVSVTADSVMAADDINCTSCNGPIVSTGSLTLSDHSVFRVAESNTNGPSLVQHTGAVSLDTSSLYLIRRSSVKDDSGALTGTIIDFTGGTFTVDGTSVVSVIDLEAGALSTNPSTTIPTTSSGTVYGGGVTVSGGLIADIPTFKTDGLIVTVLVNKDGELDGSGCQPVGCVPGRDTSVELSGTAGCQCKCITGYNQPTCMTADDPLNGMYNDCPANCVSCVGSECTECVTGYTLNQAKTECVLCQIPFCRRCEVPNVCAECLNENYSLQSDGSKCVPCNPNIVGEQCKTCEVDNTCKECQDPTTHVVIDGVCQTCPTGTHVSNGACAADPTNSPTSTPTSAPTSGPTNSPITCNVANCQTCSADGKTCVTCYTGYDKSSDGARCVPRANAARGADSVPMALLVALVSALVAAAL